MKENEKENLNKKENYNNNSMDEKILYEIKFLETEDGYRLEARGDKSMLKKLGIVPTMVGRKRPLGRKRQHRRRQGTPRHKAPRAMKGLHNTTNQPNQSIHSDPGFGSRRGFYSRRFNRHGASRSGRHHGKGFPPRQGKGYKETWDW